MTTAASTPSVRQRLGGWLREEFAPRQLITSLNAALILYLLEIIIVLSLAALIFSGELAAYLPSFLSSVLLGAALLVATVSLLSSYGGSIAVTQDTPAVILALAAASAAAALPLDSAGEELFSTVVVLIVGSTLAMGLVYLLLGAFRLGGLVRFLPYPVLGGFLAGTGWLLTVGGLSVAANLPFDQRLLQTDVLVRWLPAFLLGLLLLLTVRRWKSPLVLPVVFVLALAGFYGLMWVRGVSPATLAAEGWLLGPFPQDFAWRFPLGGGLEHVNWPALFNALPLAAPAILISVIGLLLNASSLELVTRKDVSLNRELMATGVANLFAGLVGGLIGYTAISSSTLSHSLARGKRLPGLALASLVLLTMVVGTTFLAYLPRLLLGGLLIYIGLALLHEWVIEAWSAFPKTDYAVILSVLVVIAVRDFLWGLALGLALTVVLFVISYSRVNVIHFQLSAANYRSRVTRSLRHSELLQQHGDQLLILKLQNFIFFGTAHSLFERVRQCVLGAERDRVRFVLLDFEQVTGLDSTALLSFHKLLQFARENQVVLILTGLANRTREQLRQGGFTEQTDGVRVIADMDRGIEWGEDQIIASEPGEHAPDDSLPAQLLAILSDAAQIDALVARLHRREVAAGEYIIRQGDAPDCVFFIESGQLTAQLEKPGREPIRLETMQGGRMVGELGFFLGTRRNASVVADQPSVVYFLTREAWDVMARHDAELAQTLSSIAIRLLSQRVAHLTRVVDALQH